MPAADRTTTLFSRAWAPNLGDLHIWSRLLKFVVVGGTGVLVNSFALFVLYQWVHLPLIAASILSVELAIANNFFWNNLWTFGRKDFPISRFAKFNLVSLGGMAITTSTLWVLATHVGVYYLLANLIGVGLATAWNFTVNFIWTWGWDR